MLNVYIRPDFTPDRQRMLRAIRGRIEAAVARGVALSPELCMDAAACVVDGVLIEFGGHVRHAAFDYALQCYGSEPTPVSNREYNIERQAREGGHAAALAEVKIAFASHNFRVADDADDVCSTCGLERRHDVHLPPNRGETTVAKIKDILGRDFPISGTWSGHLCFDADRYAQEIAEVITPPDLALAAE